MVVFFFDILFCCFFDGCDISADFVYFRLALVLLGPAVFSESTFSVVAVGGDAAVSAEFPLHKILPCLHFTPHALHNVPGPAGPRRHMGVVFRAQYEHALSLLAESVLFGFDFLEEDVFDLVDFIGGDGLVLLESA